MKRQSYVRQRGLQQRVTDNLFGLLAQGQVPAPGRQPGSQAGSELFRVKFRSGTSCNSFPVSDSASGYETPLPVTCQILLGTRIRTFSTPTGPGTDSNTRHCLVFQSSIGVIPTYVTIRQFSGSDEDYTTRQFLDLCESVINSSTKEDHKIVLIRFRLQPDSWALHLMQSSAFSVTNICQIIKVFKKNL